jgi:hypothetical protein
LFLSLFYLSRLGSVIIMPYTECAFHIRAVGMIGNRVEIEDENESQTTKQYTNRLEGGRKRISY